MNRILLLLLTMVIDDFLVMLSTFILDFLFSSLSCYAYQTQVSESSLCKLIMHHTWYVAFFIELRTPLICIAY